MVMPSGSSSALKITSARKDTGTLDSAAQTSVLKPPSIFYYEETRLENAVGHEDTTMSLLLLLLFLLLLLLLSLVLLLPLVFLLFLLLLFSPSSFFSFILLLLLPSLNDSDCSAASLCCSLWERQDVASSSFTLSADVDSEGQRTPH